MSEMVQDRDS